MNRRIGMMTALGMLVLGVGAFASQINLYVPDDSRDGTADQWGGVSTSVSWVGVVNNVERYAVAKFSMPSELQGKTILNATLYMRSIQDLGAGTTFLVQAQHSTFDNTEAVGYFSDWDTPLVENVGGEVNLNEAKFYSWDVTAMVTSDLQNGYGYTSYRLIDKTIQNGTYNSICETSQYPGLKSYIEVTYTPEPVSLVLLGLGGLGLIRRR